jgi:hypothetical protein
MANSINLSNIRIGAEVDNTTATLSVVSSPTSITISSVDGGGGGGLVTFSPLVPILPDSIDFPVNGTLTIRNQANPTSTFGFITKTTLLDRLSLDQVENVKVDAMEVSAKTKIELAKKQNVIDAANKITTSVVDGLDNSLSVLATKAELANVAASTSLGIKREFTSITDMNAFTTSSDNEQCAVNEGNGKRSVYTWKLLPSPAWNYVYTLSDTHTHDQYYDTTKLTNVLKDYRSKNVVIPVADVDGLPTLLNGKVDNARVLTAVPTNAVFTDEKWAGEAQMRSDYNALKAIVDNSTISDVYRRTVKTFSGTWVEIAPNVQYRIDSDGDGSSLKFVNWSKEGKVRVQRETDFPFTDTLRYSKSYLYDDDIKSYAFGYITWSGVSNWRDMNGDTFSYVTEYLRVEWERDGNRMTKVIKLEINCNELNDKRRTYTINTTVYGDKFKQA